MTEKEINYIETAEFNEREIEKLVGIDIYSTLEIKGIGGIYKCSYKDFVVKEITKKGKILQIKDDYPSPPFLEEKDRYTTFNLIKINKDTFEAVREIEKFLKIGSNLISYSGLKDKCAISVQKISIKGNFVEKLKRLNIRDSFCRCITPTKKPVKLGEHWGNNFTIVIRSIPKKKKIEKEVETLFDLISSCGFPNYYGLQRYGMYRPNSHIVGKYLLEGDYEKAFYEFTATIYSTESPRVQNIRSMINKENNLEKVYDAFPNYLFYEKLMIKHLLDNPKDFKGCFDVIPNDLKNLLISAFQSFIFNKLISLRVKMGIPLLKPVKGDVISVLEDDNSNVTQIKYIYGNNGKIYDKYLKEAIKLNRAVIVVPLIGYDTNLDDFPLIKDLYNILIKETNLNEDIFKSNLMYQYQFKGSFRAIVIKPTGLKIIQLKDDDLFPNKKSLRFEFSLTKGTYATMLLREIIK